MWLKAPEPLTFGLRIFFPLQSNHPVNISSCGQQGATCHLSNSHSALTDEPWFCLQPLDNIPAFCPEPGLQVALFISRNLTPSCFIHHSSTLDRSFNQHISAVYETGGGLTPCSGELQMCFLTVYEAPSGFRKSQYYSISSEELFLSFSLSGAIIYYTSG